jgi:hypothetical protein
VDFSDQQMQSDQRVGITRMNSNATQFRNLNSCGLNPVAVKNTFGVVSAQSRL